MATLWPSMTCTAIVPGRPVLRMPTRRSAATVSRCPTAPKSYAWLLARRHDREAGLLQPPRVRGGRAEGEAVRAPGAALRRAPGREGPLEVAEHDVAGRGGGRPGEKNERPPSGGRPYGRLPITVSPTAATVIGRRARDRAGRGPSWSAPPACVSGPSAGGARRSPRSRPSCRAAATPTAASITASRPKTARRCRRTRRRCARRRAWRSRSTRPILCPAPRPAEALGHDGRDGVALVAVRSSSPG